MRVEWVRIEGGEFLMGLAEEQTREMRRQMSWLSEPAFETLLAVETPQRVVHVPTFYISRFPITGRQFAQAGRTDRSETNDRELDVHSDLTGLAEHPALCGWHEARAFCESIGARLPSTFEWEKAARGTDGRLFPWGDEWDLARGNFGQKDRRGRVKGSRTSPVDAYPEGASPYGVQDMMGNCYEWTMTHGLFQSPYDRRNQPNRYNLIILIRGSDPDPDALHPYGHRVTRTNVGGVLRETYPPYTGFRPVMDKWQKQHWPGF